MPEPHPESTEVRLARELAAVSGKSRTEIILGALSIAAADSARRRASDSIAALAATVIAVVSLVLLVDQTRTQRKQLGAAVWPSVRVSFSNYENPEHPEYRLFLVNGGVGPARIQSFAIRWQGKPVTQVDAWARSACPDVSREWKFGTQTGTLLSPGAQAEIAAHPRRVDGVDDSCIEKVMLEPADVRICYCSALDDCWTVSRGEEPIPVHDCTAARREPQFQYGD